MMNITLLKIGNILILTISYANARQYHYNLYDTRIINDEYPRDCLHHMTNNQLSLDGVVMGRVGVGLWQMITSSVLIITIELFAIRLSGTVKSPINMLIALNLQYVHRIFSPHRNTIFIARTYVVM
ncbi:unnamed protein product [Rotaria magnacalcarata]|uniref:Uncharacterized protein n=1 Tax=Rotaria magnacalcarata TaxID=392030 RepID=A0A8S3IJ02_9BILA|nr:unnamed protein product [Rotaria magnacalcarata]